MKKISKPILALKKPILSLALFIATSLTASADLSINITLNDANKSVTVEATGNLSYTNEAYYSRIISPYYSNKLTTYNNGRFFAGNNYGSTDSNAIAITRTDEGAATWVYDGLQFGYGDVGLTDTSWGDNDRLYIYLTSPTTQSGGEIGNLYINKSFFTDEGASLSNEYGGYNINYDLLRNGIIEMFGNRATFVGYHEYEDHNTLTINVLFEPGWVDSDTYGTVYSYTGNDTDSNQWLWQWNAESFIYVTEVQDNGIWTWYAK